MMSHEPMVYKVWVHVNGRTVGTCHEASFQYDTECGSRHHSGVCHLNIEGMIPDPFEFEDPKGLLEWIL